MFPDPLIHFLFRVGETSTHKAHLAARPRQRRLATPESRGLPDTTVPRGRASHADQRLARRCCPMSCFVQSRERRCRHDEGVGEGERKEEQKGKN